MAAVDVKGLMHRSHTAPHDSSAAQCLVIEMYGERMALASTTMKKCFMMYLTMLTVGVLRSSRRRADMCR